jgi:hypothetical protein
MNSALPYISQPVSSEARRRRMSGVLPMASTTDDFTFMDRIVRADSDAFEEFGGG